MLHPEGILVLVGILVSAFTLTRLLSGSPLPSILGFASSITSSQVEQETNQQRAALGIGALTDNPTLDQAAKAKGNNMCADQYWAHISPSGVTPWVFMKNAGYHYAVAGENLARDFSDTPSMVAAWMASPTHRENMVNTRYKEIGVAVIDCNLLGSDTALVVQMFGTQLVGEPTTTQTAAATIQPSTAPQTATPPTPAPPVLSETTSQPQVAGEESAPQFISAADPTLQLATPAPQANPTNLRVLSPLQVVKAIMVSMLFVLLVVLLVDLWLEEKHHTVRLVGKNLAHIIFLSGILLVVLIIKVGIVN